MRRLQRLEDSHLFVIDQKNREIAIQDSIISIKSKDLLKYRVEARENLDKAEQEERWKNAWMGATGGSGVVAIILAAILIIN